ncbi:MAG: hypothetical protein ABFS37_05375, partial [Acidobacteriota bacterium]
AAPVPAQEVPSPGLQTRQQDQGQQQMAGTATVNRGGNSDRVSEQEHPDLRGYSRGSATL